ncbi:hypothetical protein [Wolbachia endosymbiont (group B) of Erebia ligea]|uniref:hypothetical protein n=1 Tax=Wolbachia endosymbiont (group B) of Erebia ligea TaxID=2954010 RepID=UPI0021F8B5F3|nr:hypothetical protein [Wolbachia endosymbiont (group B) of Erebia ligea]
MEGKALHEFLEGYLEQDAQSQKKECIITLNPSSHLLNSLKPGELQAGCIGGAYDHYLPRTMLEGPSAEEKSNPEYRSYDRFR